jgi:tetratricopeptide (TPR) repeat protein
MKKRGFLIGNREYPENELYNPVNDVTALKTVLEKVGFEIQVRTDLNSKNFIQALEEFQNWISNSDIALFYYSGHGTRDRNMDYMLPLDFTKETSISLEETLKKRRKLNLIILDMCRTDGEEVLDTLSVDRLYKEISRDIFAKGFTFAVPENSKNITIYSSNKRQPSCDTDFSEKTSLSTFTKFLVKEISNPYENIYQMLSETFKSVKKYSREEQTPVITGDTDCSFTFTQMSGEFYFQKGNYLFDNNEFEEALKFFNLAEELGVKNSQLFEKKSQIHFKQNKQDFGLKEFSKYAVLEHSEKSDMQKSWNYFYDRAIFFFSMSFVTLNKFHLNSSLEFSEKAVALKPKCEKSLFIRYKAYREKGELFKAFLLIQKTIRNSKDITVFYIYLYERGKIFLECKKCSQALEDFQQTILYFNKLGIPDEVSPVEIDEVHKLISQAQMCMAGIEIDEKEDEVPIRVIRV